MRFSFSCTMKAVQTFVPITNTKRGGSLNFSFPEPANGEAMDSKVTRVVLADDHARVRAGIRNLLNNTPDIVVVGEAGNGEEALRLVQTLEPDVLLLDIEMPIMDGNEVASVLRKNESPVRILALSAYDDSQYIIGMLNNGASGYLMKEEVPEVLIKAVRSIANGEKGWVSKRVKDKIDARISAERIRHTTFTRRELDILRRLADGKNLQEIASEMKIESNLVERHIVRLCKKLSVDSRDTLAHYARINDLI
jgi:two-component system, NarL family, response regulator DegU